MVGEGMFSLFFSIPDVGFSVRRLSDSTVIPLVGAYRANDMIMLVDWIKSIHRESYCWSLSIQKSPCSYIS